MKEGGFNVTNATIQHLLLAILKSTKEFTLGLNTRVTFVIILLFVPVILKDTV